MTRLRRRLGRWFLAALAAAGLFLAETPSAAAHAVLVAADPADGAVVAASPSRLSLIFSEPVSPIAVRLLCPGGTAEDAEVAADGERLAVTPRSVLASGTHALSWRVISADGHPVGGAVLFSIGAPGGGVDALDQSVDWPRRAALWAAKVALYLGLFVGAGGAFAIAWIAEGRAGGRRLTTAALAVGLPAAGLSLGLQGVDALDAPLSALFGVVAWREGLATSFGATAWLAVASVVLGAASLGCARPGARASSLLSLALVGVALAASGHASAAAPQWLMRPAVFLHATAVAFWIGALGPLAAALRTAAGGGAATLRRFSAAAPWAVAPLLVAGLALAIVQVGAPAALWSTAYGRVLLAKLALVAGLFAFAAFNRWRLTAPAAGGDALASRRLVRSIAVELALALAIFGVVALWRFTPPPRALAVAAAAPALAHLQSAQAMADVTLTPGDARQARASVVVMSGDFGPLDAKAVTLLFSNPAAGVEPIRREAFKPGDGTWRVDGLSLPAPGRWSVGVEILVTDFDQERLDGEIDVRR